MLTITKPAPNRVDIAISGALDSDAMQTGLDDLIAKSEDVAGGRMLYRFENFAMPTIGALGVELKRLPKLFGLLGKFDRCALVSDVAWLRTAAEIEGKLIPGLEIKSFEPDRIGDAEAWLEAA